MLEIQTGTFGKLAQGGTATRFEVLVDGQVRLVATDFGATIVSIMAPDRSGRLDDVVLGFDDATKYEVDPHYIGATIGRVANRIKGASYRDGSLVQLTRNEGKNQLHGGARGFDQRLWRCSPELVSPTRASLHFHYESPAGEEGYPGKLDATVKLSLDMTKEMQVEIEYSAIPSVTSPVNLTHHEYWNLSGRPAEETMLEHQLQINAPHYLPTDGEDIPTGALSAVEGTAFDFKVPASLSDKHSSYPALLTHGFNHCFALEPSLAPAATLTHPPSGRQLSLLTSQPGLQFYNSGFMGVTQGKGGAQYGKFSGICLEAQGFPDAVNQPAFPSVMVQAGTVYRHKTVYAFETV